VALVSNRCLSSYLFLPDTITVVSTIVVAAAVAFADVVIATVLIAFVSLVGTLHGDTGLPDTVSGFGEQSLPFLIHVLT
jgi:hypothetical protein